MEVAGYGNPPQKLHSKYWKTVVSGAVGTVSSVINLHFFSFLAAFKLPCQSTFDPRY